jgi:hypothetical protein
MFLEAIRPDFLEAMVTPAVTFKGIYAGPELSAAGTVPMSGRMFGTVILNISPGGILWQVTGVGRLVTAGMPATIRGIAVHDPRHQYKKNE